MDTIKRKRVFEQVKIDSILVIIEVKESGVVNNGEVLENDGRVGDDGGHGGEEGEVTVGVGFERTVGMGMGIDLDE